MAQPKTTTRVRRKINPRTGEAISTTVERITVDTGSSVSAEAKANRARAGAANLAKWRADQTANPDTTVEAGVAAFRASLDKDAGSEPSAAERILVEGSVAAYSAMLTCITKLKSTRNSFERTLELTREITSLQKALLRSSKALAEMRTGDPNDSINAELEQIEKDIHSQREQKPS